MTCCCICPLPPTGFVLVWASLTSLVLHALQWKFPLLLMTPWASTRPLPPPLPVPTIQQSGIEADEEEDEDAEDESESSHGMKNFEMFVQEHKEKMRGSVLCLLASSPFRFVSFQW